MRSSYSPPWTLRCPWCEFYIVVNNRGGFGRYEGAGVEAADRMQAHVGAHHDRTWREFIAAGGAEGDPDG